MKYVFLIFVFVSCAYGTKTERIERMTVGLSKEDVGGELGPPKAAYREGSADIWVYSDRNARCEIHFINGQTSNIDCGDIATRDKQDRLIRAREKEVINQAIQAYQ